ncbi:uncharacterized protein M421DRAFT_7858 [Didymella exigua CBS 183.55]|uniref:EthD domain-containing protein n=1 Tax=Didymella exigua CBS 183.55 TaxID=1150837 RepID=A0A6A5RDS5_9PLEO|nr:uncharacterized protein M421DRAFT_7858 [Didymella exigua CBS 183.55]KAF1925603.1 hypothetical protein M421DRAFT_7858 [Didymella exigua CBS 183.55]
MSCSAPRLKQIACVRRKSNLTRKEFFDYHFLVHGSISDEPTDVDQKPHKYIQTHFFDSAFGERPGSLRGTGNYPWTGRDGMTELYFRDWDHLKACFGSEFVRTKIGPDGANFNDLETAIPMMVLEKSLEFESNRPSSVLPDEGYQTVAVLFVASGSKDSAEQLEHTFSPALVNALRKHAQDEVYGLQANISIPSSQFDIRAHFGGQNMPEYPVTYKIYMKDTASVTSVRNAQKAFIEGLSEQVDASNTFIAFGKEGLILDVGNEVKFDSSRQPQIL